MNQLVLDTDVSSRVFRGRHTARLKAKLSDQALCVTFVTVGELWKWAEGRDWGWRTRAELEHWLSGLKILESDDEVSRTWGRMAAAGERRGRPRPPNDMWIAACCLARGLPLVTYNVKDFVDFVDHEGLSLVES